MLIISVVLFLIALSLIFIILFFGFSDKEFGGLKVTPDMEATSGSMPGKILMKLVFNTKNNSNLYLVASTLKVSTNYGDCSIYIVDSRENIPLYSWSSNIVSIYIDISGDHCKGKEGDKYYFNISGTFIDNNKTISDSLILKGKYHKEWIQWHF